MYTLQEVYYTNITQCVYWGYNAQSVIEEIDEGCKPKIFSYMVERALNPHYVIYQGYFLFSTTKPTINIIILLTGYQKLEWKVY